MSNLNTVKSDVEKFRAAVKTLSDTIGKVGIDWHDEKHEKLKLLVSNIASESKSVLLASEKFVQRAKEFESIANQK